MYIYIYTQLHIPQNCDGVDMFANILTNRCVNELLGGNGCGGASAALWRRHGP